VGAVPALRVSSTAHWTMRALQGGYARKLLKSGQLSRDPEDNAYAVVMAALASFAGLTANPMDDMAGHVEYTEDGRPYLSARATRG